ncbi:MAG: S8 family serine peptidase [Pyrinomonadaceae bacterium]|nr:S8 family serine peptidase [Pyrinomonadaceae bacterium]
MASFSNSHARRRPSSLRRRFLKHTSRFWLLGLALLLTLAFFVAGGFVANSSAQGNRTDGEAAFEEKADKILKRVRHALDEDRSAAAKGRLRSETSQVSRLARLTGIQRRSATSATIDLAVTLAADSDVDLKAAGFALQSRTGDIATLTIDIDRLEDLAMVPSVRKMVASAFRYPLNDRARQSAGIDNSSAQRMVSQTGRGVVVGIVDTGIDFRHRDFTVPGTDGKQTRIKAILDMTVYSSQSGSQSPDPNWNYSLPDQSAAIGHLYTEAEINSALQSAKPADQNSDSIKQRDKNGHGTHVAATAAGNGLAAPAPGTYAGMAPEADLVIVKASRANDGDDDFRTTDVINAMEFIRQRAAELGKPFVINLSLGGQLGPHDGTNPDERAIDNLVNGGNGRAVVVAAGNEGDSSIHARSTVPAGGSQTLDFNVNGAAHVVDLYQHQADRFAVTVTSPDGVTLGPVSYNANGFSLPNGQASNQYLEAYNANDNKSDSDASNDQPDIVLLFKPEAPDGMWKITLQDADGNANQSYDAWAEGEGVYFSTNVDRDSHLVGSPGTARGAITVGAFVSRSSSQTTGAPATFTSPGPTADGRQKPEISAPGFYLYSARSTDVTAANFGTLGTGANAPTDSTHYAGLAGTSMATPVTTGSVALLLETNATASADEIKDLLTTYAVQDIFTGSGWSPRLGLGKLNIANSINRTGGGFRKYSISGSLTRQDGSGFSGIQVFLSGSQHAMAITDSSGGYSFSNLSAGGNYKVEPSFQGGLTVYTPGSYSFNSLSSNQTANFAVSTAETFRVSGRITDSLGNGIAGIRVEFPGSTTPVGNFPILGQSTDSNGNYAVNLAQGKNHTVMPTSEIYTIAPGSISFANLSSNQTGANFTASPRAISVRGRVTDSVHGMAGVLVTLSSVGNPPVVTTVTDASGEYTLSGAIAQQQYTITPSKVGYVFEVPSQTANVYPNMFFNFIGRPGTYIDDSKNFVTQQYRDFLGREPDGDGLAFWTNEISSCGAYLPCIDFKRVNVSAAFFLSIEFQETGYLVYRTYKAAYGNLPGAPVPMTLSEFLPDTRQIGQGVVVGAAGWEGLLQNNKNGFFADFVTRSKFTNAFPDTWTSSQFVDALFSNAGVTPSALDRAAAIDEFGGAGGSTNTTARARVLRRVAENSILAQQEKNRAFVLTQYFGYLRRNPNDAPEIGLNFEGYNFWLGKLDQFNGNYVAAEMVKAFITSGEYRQRFAH